jgi:acetyl esterase/lipase
MPIRVFYPIKVSNINKVIIYIHGNGKITNCVNEYSNICRNLAIKTNRLVIGVEYQELKRNYKEMYNNIYLIIKYLYKELEKNDISNSNICLVGDSTGCNIITGINYLNKDLNIEKEVLFYPTLSLEYFGETNYLSFSKNEAFNINLINKLSKYFTYIAYKKDLGDKLLNPLKLDDYSKIPSTLIFTGTMDVLKDEANDYYNKLITCSNKHFLKEVPFSSHGFLNKIDNELEEEVYLELNNFLM